MTLARIENQDNIAIIWLDQAGAAVNKISLDLLDVCEEYLEEIEENEEVHGVVLISGKADSFIAGADLDEFVYMPNRERAEMLSRRGHGLLNRIADFPKPVVAAIHGATLGGGLEVALACTYRIATDNPQTVFAFPEVKLGLLPAGAGTQLLPRLIGLKPALDMMLTGRNIYPHRAQKMGLVDDLIHHYGLLAAAKQAVLDLRERPVRRRTPQPLVYRFVERIPAGRRLMYRQARRMVRKKTSGKYPAPFKIIECIETGMETGMDAGLKAEEDRFGQLAVSSQARELIRLFFYMRALKKNLLKEQIRPVATLGIVGSGLMGGGIAAVSVQRGMDVVIRDVDYEALGRGEKAIWQHLERRVKQGVLTPFARDRLFSRISATVLNRGFEKADIVIEAVYEDLELKQRILASMEVIMRDDAIFASNTSSLPISSIAQNARRPKQVIGMHYFSPVPQMPLLEIVVTDKTANWVTATAVETGIRQGKTVIVVHDGPGFYTTRILAPLLNEALLLIEEGASITEVDDALCEFGFPVGPLALIDDVGIDVGAHVSKILGPFFAERGVKLSRSMEALCRAGYRGRKNNRGFYRYSRRRNGTRRNTPNREIYSFFGGKKRISFDRDILQDRLSYVMINEAARCLEEGILRTSRDGDIGAVFGLGFPAFLGGPFRYMDNYGIRRILGRLETLENMYGARFSPAEIIRRKVQSNEHFHQMNVSDKHDES